ncbi:hypothetical protein GCM10010446_17310 [Streptomyces enissocaesilis]|uniref:Uncharacterized protein n=1 Tax=Streptomyces enissocaesilis TaxID=332589 RepID=A0ABP6JKG2_9ACTN
MPPGHGRALADTAMETDMQIETATALAVLAAGAAKSAATAVPAKAARWPRRADPAPVELMSSG